MEIGDKHNIWGQMGPKVMTLEPFSLQENYIVVVSACILLLYFFFLKGFNHTYGIQNISGIYKFSLSVHLAICKFFRLSFSSSVDHSFALNVFYYRHVYLCSNITDLFHIYTMIPQ